MNIENLQNLLGSGDVVRYHTTPRVRPQSVAQHAWGAALIYQYLVGPDERAYIMPVLLHDCAEAFVGDIPAPIKARAEVAAVFEEIEKIIGYVKFGGRVSTPKPLAVVADKLEALYWTWRDGGADARTLNRGIAAHIADILKELLLTDDERGRAEELLKAWSL